jgi:hypothetical protein
VGGFAPVRDNVDFARCVCLCPPLSLNSSAAPSSATIAVACAGIPRCNSAVPPAADQNAVRIPSADNGVPKPKFQHCFGVRN